jgi:hypothetical protein
LAACCAAEREAQTAIKEIITRMADKLEARRNKDMHSS